MKQIISDKFKKTLKTIFQKRVETEESRKNDRRNKIIVYLILAAVSLVLTILNIINQYWLMTGTTAGLFVICLVCVLIVWKTDNRLAPDILLSIGIAFLFSYYAASGQNDGFAILWILLVPTVGMLLLSFKVGLVVSIYFLLFLIVIFYTPVKDYIPAVTRGPYYTKTFMIRFPLLYIADLLTALALTSQKIYYLNKAQNYSLFDQMTGLRNRRYFMDLFDKYEKSIDKMPMDTAIVALDLNNLKLINDKFGHIKGDDAIKRTTLLLNNHFGSFTDFIYRVGGDEFMVIFEDKNNNIDEMLRNYEEDMSNQLYQGYPLSISYGYVKRRDYIDSDFKSLISIAEKNMYSCKENYYKKNKIERYRGKYEDFD